MQHNPGDFEVRITRISRLAACLLCVLLYGCGYESVGDWKPGGNPSIPKDPRSKEGVVRTVLKEGEGPEIQAGSLVHARVVSAEYLPGAAPTPTASIVSRVPLPDVWFWLGDDSAIPGYKAYEHRELIDLGSPTLRAAFAGLRRGSHVSIVLEGAPNYPDSLLPTRGMVFNYSESRRHGQSTGSGPDHLPLRSKARYEFRVEDVCNGRLLYRQAKRREWGFVPKLAGDPSTPFFRVGTIEWTAIEADCDAPADLRIEMGPGYRQGLTKELSSRLPDNYLVTPARGKIAKR